MITSKARIKAINVLRGCREKAVAEIVHIKIAANEFNAPVNTVCIFRLVLEFIKESSLKVENLKVQTQ